MGWLSVLERAFWGFLLLFALLHLFPLFRLFVTGTVGAEPVAGTLASERELAGRSLSAVGDSPKMSHCGWHAATVGGRCLAVGFSHVMRRVRRKVWFGQPLRVTWVSCNRVLVPDLLQAATYVVVAAMVPSSLVAQGAV